jgi:hypothetical protein
MQFTYSDIVISTNICSDTNNFSITDIVIESARNNKSKIKGDLLIIKNIRLRNNKVWINHCYITKTARAKIVVATPTIKVRRL